MSEDSLRKAFQELEGSPQVQIFASEQGPLAEEFGDAPAVFEKIASWRGIELDASLQRCFIRFTTLASHWRIERPGIKLTGEFRIRHPLYMMDVHAPESDWATTESEAQFYSELRVIDDRTGSGTGAFAALRVQPGNSMPEVWYHDLHRGAFKLDIDYCQYLDVLCVTKGVSGWQYLFTDTSLAERDFKSFAHNLETSLEVFPELFPGYDYEPLRARLTARL
jgi:hypothetical protein